MRYQPLPATFHTANRQKLSAAIGPDAIAIIDTADVLRRPGDFEHPFHPDSNFYYLTGIDEPDAVLLLAPATPTRHCAKSCFSRKPATSFPYGPAAASRRRRGPSAPGY